MKLKLGVNVSLFKRGNDDSVKLYETEYIEFDLVESKSTMIEKIIEFVYEFLLGCKIKLMNELGLSQSDLDNILKGK